MLPTFLLAHFLRLVITQATRPTIWPTTLIYIKVANPRPIISGGNRISSSATGIEIFHWENKRE